MLHLLHRSIFRELCRVFFLALVGLTALLLLAGIIAEATQRGLGPGQILGAIPLLIPSTLPYTLPTTTLFATCVVYGRLAADNEILAVKAAGIHLIHVIWPAVLLGLITMGVTFGLYMHVIPSSQHVLRSRVVENFEEFLYGMLKREGCIRHPKINFVIDVKQVREHKLLEAQFRRRDPKGNFDITARASEAELRVDMAKKVILVHMKRCYVQGETGKDDLYFEDKIWPVELPPDINPGDKNSAREMTWVELFDHRQRLSQEVEKVTADIATFEARILQKNFEPNWPDHVRALKFEKKIKENLINNMSTEMQMRPALAVGCLCFVLVGCPVGIWFSKSDFLSAFITCFLPIVTTYYPLLLCGINLSKSGNLSPILAMWAANVMMGVVALFLFRRLLKN